MILQKKIYDTLSALEVPVVKYLHEYKAIYPVIVYQEISNVPAMSGDNAEILRRVTFQISIGTENDDYADLESDVEAAMLNLGFTRVDSRDILDGVYWRVIRFKILWQG